MSSQQRISCPSARCWALILAAATLAFAVRAAGQTPAVTLPDLAAHLSNAPAAMEYWDLTGQFESGHLLFARFLITNEGPGLHIGAIAGHLVLPTGATTRMKWGRTRDDWTISPDRRRLKIGKAVLDMNNATTVLDVNTDKHGIKIHIESARPSAPIALDPDPGEYSVEVVTPLPARGTVWLRGMDAPVAVEGTMALTHCWMERSEAKILLQRNEVLAAIEGTGLYLSDVAFVDGRRRATLLVTRDGHVVYRADVPTLAWAGTPMLPGDARYPVAEAWESRSEDVEFVASLRREWLRWDPLEVVPAPFRWFLAMKSRPQRVWADTDVTLTVAAQPDRPALATQGRGIAVVTFQHPVAAR